MSASTDIGSSPAVATTEDSHVMRFSVRASSTDAALITDAAAARHMSTAEFVLHAAIAEARTAMTDDRQLFLTTDDRRIGLINEAFDRLAEALSESGKTVDVLIDLIQRAKYQAATEQSEGFGKRPHPRRPS